MHRPLVTDLYSIFITVLKADKEPGYEAAYAHVVYYFKSHSMVYTNSITDNVPGNAKNVKNLEKAKKFARLFLNAI